MGIEIQVCEAYMFNLNFKIIKMAIIKLLHVENWN